MEQSILTSVKKNLGLAEDYTAFDHDVITYVNSAFSTLNELGLGPVDGFMIEDADPEWSAFFTDPRLNSVKTYVYLRVRMLFDPPTTSYLVSAMQEQIDQLTWRLNAIREHTGWINPNQYEEVTDE